MLFIDIGKGYLNYGIAYFWIMGQGITKNGEPILFNFEDGLGSGFTNYMKASGDFITINGRITKLDSSRLTYDKDNYLSKVKVETIEDREE